MPCLLGAQGAVDARVHLVLEEPVNGGFEVEVVEEHGATSAGGTKAHGDEHGQGLLGLVGNRDRLDRDHAHGEVRRERGRDSSRAISSWSSNRLSGGLSGLSSDGRLGRLGRRGRGDGGSLDSRWDNVEGRRGDAHLLQALSHLIDEVADDVVAWSSPRSQRRLSDRADGSRLSLDWLRWRLREVSDVAWR